MSDDSKPVVKETIYISHCGEFLRETWVRERYTVLPARMVRPILSDAQTRRLYEAPADLRQEYLRGMVVTEGVEEREYYPNEYTTEGRPAYNAEIVEDLVEYGFLRARRFPEVVFYVTELEPYLADPERSSKVHHHCRLTTTGDTLDLVRFANNLRLNPDRLEQAGSPCQFFLLTPKKRQRALADGAKETTRHEETERVLRLMKDFGKGAAN